MTPGRNPSEERLLAYAAGVLSPPEAVVVAAHLALRPANDAWVRRLQGVGGAFLETTPPAAMSADALGWRASCRSRFGATPSGRGAGSVQGCGSATSMRRGTGTAG